MAQTTRDWPRRMSPAAKTFSAPAAKLPSAVETVPSQSAPKASHTAGSHPEKPVAATSSVQGSVSPSEVATPVRAPFSETSSRTWTPKRRGSRPKTARASSWA